MTLDVKRTHYYNSGQNDELPQNKLQASEAALGFAASDCYSQVMM